MKKILMVVFIVLFTASPALCGEFEETLKKAEQGDAKAQTARFKAEVKPDGSIELIPMDVDTPSSLAKGTGMPETFGGEEFFLVKDQAGVVEGIYADQAAVMGHPLSPGDSIQVLDATPGALVQISQRPPDDVDEDMLNKVAKEAAKKLLAMVKESACEFDPLPETVSPTVEVSFNLLAGTRLSIQATWNTAKVCSD